MSNIAVMKGVAVLRDKKYKLAPGYVSRTAPPSRSRAGTSAPRASTAKS